MERGVWETCGLGEMEGCTCLREINRMTCGGKTASFPAPASLPEPEPDNAPTEPAGTESLHCPALPNHLMLKWRNLIRDNTYQKAGACWLLPEFPGLNLGKDIMWDLFSYKTVCFKMMDTTNVRIFAIITWATVTVQPKETEDHNSVLYQQFDP